MSWEDRCVEEVVRRRIVGLHPSLRPIGNAVLVKYSDAVPTACITEDWVMLYGDWFRELVLSERNGGSNGQRDGNTVTAVIEHEIQHVMRGHFERGDEIKAWDGGLAVQRWLLATDLEINSSTESCRALRGTLPGGNDAAFPDQYGYGWKLAAETYYKALKQEQEKREEEGQQSSEGEQGEKGESTSGRGQSEQSEQNKQSEQGKSSDGDDGNENAKDDQEGEQEQSDRESEGGQGSPSESSNQSSQEDGADGADGSQDSEEAQEAQEEGQEQNEESSDGDGSGLPDQPEEAKGERREIQDEEYDGCSHNADDGLTELERQEQRKRIREATEQVVISWLDELIGNDPEGRDYILRIANLDRRWQKALTGAVEKLVKRGHGRKTYAQPARRGNFDQVVRPGEVRTHAKVAVVIDVSGSMEKEAINAAVGVVAALSRQIGGQLHVSLVDDALRWQGYSANGRDILRRLPVNGNGTDFTLMLDSGKKIHPETIVLLTDCEGDFPGQCNVPVVIGRINSRRDPVIWNEQKTVRGKDISYIRDIIQVPLQPSK
jgi:predicted metal-dependent peptidase